MNKTVNLECASQNLRHIINGIIQSWLEWLRVSTTSLGSLFQYLITFIVNRFFLSLPWNSFVPFLSILSPVKREKSLALPLHFPFSGSCREKWCHFSAPSSSHWAIQVFSNSAHRTCLPAFLLLCCPFLYAFTYLTESQNGLVWKES